MNGPRPDPRPVLPILGILAADAERAEGAAISFGEGLGGVELRSEPVVFDGTRYYEEEMGAGLHRRFVGFSQLVPATALIELKLQAWRMEQEGSRDGRRAVNLDPGFLDLHKVVLASFKPGPQKLFLGGGVWADTVLFFDSGKYTALRWTFPDLREGKHGEFFAAARERYKQLLRAV